MLWGDLPGIWVNRCVRVHAGKRLIRLLFVDSVHTIRCSCRKIGQYRITSVQSPFPQPGIHITRREPSEILLMDFLHEARYTHTELCSMSSLSLSSFRKHCTASLNPLLLSGFSKQRFSSFSPSFWPSPLLPVHPILPYTLRTFAQLLFDLGIIQVPQQPRPD